MWVILLNTLAQNCLQIWMLELNKYQVNSLIHSYEVEAGVLKLYITEK